MTESFRRELKWASIVSFDRSLITLYNTERTHINSQKIICLICWLIFDEVLFLSFPCSRIHWPLCVNTNFLPFFFVFCCWLKSDWVFVGRRRVCASMPNHYCLYYKLYIILRYINFERYFFIWCYCCCFCFCSKTGFILPTFVMWDTIKATHSKAMS